MTSESVARRLHTAASTDAALASDLHAAYRGRHEVLDALWWRAHPLTETPGGRPDPAADLPRLQAAVYSRTRAASPDGESEQQLRDLTNLLRQDAVDLDEVLLRFREARALPRVSPRDARPAAASGLTEAGDPPSGTAGAFAVEARESGPSAPAHGRFPRMFRGPGVRRTLLLLAAGVVAGAVAVGAVVALVPRGGPATGSVDEALASASPGLVQLFDQPLIPDQAAIDLGPEFRRDSIHSMFVERETSSFVYVARRGEDLYCIILRSQGEQGASVCVGLGELARRGLTLTATVPVNPFTLGKDSLEQAGALADVTIRLDTNGNVTSETVPHPTS